MIKKGSHLDGVEPINEKNIEKSIVLEILYKKIGEYKEAYKYILNIIEDKLIYDKSGYSGNSVLILKSKDGKEDFVIKISKSNELYHEYISYNFFYNLEYTTKPLAYFECGKYEILITKKINLPTAGYYFNSYKDIAKFFGKKLKIFHEQNLINKVKNNEEKNVFSHKYEKSYKKAISNTIVLKYLASYLKNNNVS